jgi:hypothetical protein
MHCHLRLFTQPVHGLPNSFRYTYLTPVHQEGQVREQSFFRSATPNNQIASSTMWGAASGPVLSASTAG